MLTFVLGCPPPPNPPTDVVSDVSSDDIAIPSKITPAPTSGSNTPCVSDDECPGEEICFEEAGQCRTPCTDDLECPDSSKCDDEAGLCVQCEEDADCAFGVCHPELKSCVFCANDDDCSGPAAACHPEAFICVQCTRDDHCPFGICDPGSFQCVECIGHDDCADEDPCTQDVCVDRLCQHPQLNTAECQNIECLVDADCSAPDGGCARCEDWVCVVEVAEVACNFDTDCITLGGNACNKPTCAAVSCGGTQCELQPVDNCIPCTLDEECATDSSDVCSSQLFEIYWLCAVSESYHWLRVDRPEP